MTCLPEFNLFGEATPPPPPPKPNFRPVYQAYELAGGRLDKVGRNMLGQQARRLVADGYPIEQVTRAAGELGRSGNYPVFLGRMVREMPEPCSNGEQRARLTQEQLASCPCASCKRWLELRKDQPLRI